ncbi:MAG: diguanylate cyclase [Minwuiales bacterium]|nr:diguanylate cyclase [Minwuiales bacterium]
MTGFPGPGAIVDSEGRVFALNGQGAPIELVLAEAVDVDLPFLITRACVEQSVQQHRLRLPAEHGGLTLDLTIVPFAADRALVLARDSTMERNMIEALIMSRQLFKDLVNCSSDFAWQTDADGTFDYVSPRGALGYGAHELNAMRAGSLEVVGDWTDTSSPFEARSPLENREILIRRKDGSLAHLLMSSVPVTDADGNWRGCRGVCRDVTAEREQQAALERADRRMRLEYEIVNSIHKELHPERALRAAASVTARLTGAGRVLIWRVDADDRPTPVGDSDHAGTASRQAIVTTAHGALRRRPSEEPVLLTEIASSPAVAADFDYGGEIKGGLCAIGRDGKTWAEDDGLLIGRVAAHLGIAVAQIEAYEALENLSLTDELTGLLNRRAFMAQIAQRLAHQRRTGRGAALLYIDMDNFKPINDLYGHQMGDRVLRRFGRFLKESSRVGDIAARLGGDEFALWLEDTGEVGACHKAGLLVDQAAPALADVAAELNAALSLSVGVATTAPAAGETVDALVARADAAMYRAKRAGKSGFSVAPPPAGAEAEQTR